MTEMEKEILLLISRMRCITETQFSKIFKTKRRYSKKILRKMCNEYVLRKYPCNISHLGYKDNSYVYYLNGAKTYKGKELTKVVIGSEIAIKINLLGHSIKRFYRNISVSNIKYDIFIEYENLHGELKQLLVDIDLDLDDKIKSYKYRGIKNKIEESTIPFYRLPNILIVTPKEIDKLGSEYDKNINFIDINLNKISRALE